MQLSIFVVRWYEVIMIHSGCPCFTTFTAGNGTPKCRCPSNSTVKGKTSTPYLESIKSLFAVTLHRGTFPRDGCKMDCCLFFKVQLDSLRVYAFFRSLDNIHTIKFFLLNKPVKICKNSDFPYFICKMSLIPNGSKNIFGKCKSIRKSQLDGDKYLYSYKLLLWFINTSIISILVAASWGMVMLLCLLQRGAETLEDWGSPHRTFSFLIWIINLCSFHH